MRPVNLLPERYRPRTPGSGDTKSAYIALGALALLVLAVFGYVMTSNQVSSRNSEIAQTRQQIAAAEAQTVTLKGFGDFAAVKEARLEAVTSLATARLDWERLFRELAHVLPSGVWLTGFNGETASTTASAGETGGQTLNLKGCADDHRQIADVMVRLRELHVAEDVEIVTTSGPADEDEGGATATPGAAETGCGPYHTFEINVKLATALPGLPSGDGATVPARLGGGQ